MLPQIEDNRFSPQIAALAMPDDKTNMFSALGDSLVKWGNQYNANQLFDLQKQKTQKELDTADMNMKLAQQNYDFNEQANPLKLEDAKKGLQLKDTQNKLYTTQANDAQFTLDDKVGIKNLYGYLKGLDPDKQKAFFQDPTISNGLTYKDPFTGEDRSYTPAQIGAVKQMFEGEDLTKKKTEAEIKHYNDTGTAALMTAKAHMITANAKENQATTPKINIASVQRAAQEASRASVAANAFKGILDNYSDDLVGWMDNGIDSIISALSLNTQDATKNRLMKQNITALVGTAKDLIDLKGQDSKAKLELIASMTPQMSDSEQVFKTKTASLFNFIKDSYNSKLNTYNPATTPPEQYAAWVGNLQALGALEPKIQQFVGGKNSGAGEQNLTSVATSKVASSQQLKTGATMMDSGTSAKPTGKFGTYNGQRVQLWSDGSVRPVQ